MFRSPVLHNQLEMDLWLKSKRYAFNPDHGTVVETFPCIAVISEQEDIIRDKVTSQLTCIKLSFFEWKNGILIHENNAGLIIWNLVAVKG